MTDARNSDNLYALAAFGHHDLYDDSGRQQNTMGLALGLANQALWLVWIVSSASWGLLPMNIALWIVYGRNHWKWMSEKVA